MTRLIAMRGLPGSGKSTRALELLNKTTVGTLARCSRDAYRRMLHGQPRHGDRVCEDQVTIAQHAAIEGLLLAGVDVLVDDTNLSLINLQALAAIAWRCGAEFEVEDFTHVPLDECIARDALRCDDERVGEDLIRAMHRRHLLGKPLPLPVPTPNLIADLLGPVPDLRAQSCGRCSITYPASARRWTRCSMSESVSFFSRHSTCRSTQHSPLHSLASTVT